ERFQRLLAEEARMAETARVVTGGSQTADKLAEIADMAGLPVEAMMQAAMGSPRGIVQALLSESARARLRGLQGSVADELSPRLTAGAESPFDLQRALAELEAFA